MHFGQKMRISRRGGFAWTLPQFRLGSNACATATLRHVPGLACIVGTFESSQSPLWLL